MSHPPHLRNSGETRLTINWGADFLKGELIVPTVTCFADIPLECLRMHTKKYGQFGLAIDRKILVQCEARPVTYLPYDPADFTPRSNMGLITHFCKTVEGFENLVVANNKAKPIIVRGKVPDSPEYAINAVSSVLLKDFLAFLKPFDSTLGDEHHENYYTEREWRRFGNLELKRPEWVQKIVVAADYVDRLKADFPEYEDRVCKCPA